MTVSIEDIFNSSYRSLLNILGKEGPKITSSYSLRLARAEVIFLYYVQNLLDQRSNELYQMPGYFVCIHNVNSYEALLENIDIDYVTEKTRNYYYDNITFTYKAPINMRSVINYIESEDGKKFIQNHVNDRDCKAVLELD